MMRCKRDIPPKADPKCGGVLCWTVQRISARLSPKFDPERAPVESYRNRTFCIYYSKACTGFSTGFFLLFGSRRVKAVILGIFVGGIGK